MLIARQGDQAPGTTSGVTFSVFDSRPYMNVHGDIVFDAFITGPGVTSANSRGIWRTGPNGLELVVRSNSVAPGATFTDFETFLGHSAINSSGVVSFGADLEAIGPSIESSYPGIWTGEPGALELVSLDGLTPPGLSNDYIFIHTSGQTYLHDSGAVAFIADILGPDTESNVNDLSFWVSENGVLRQVARLGDDLPGTGGTEQIINLIGVPVFFGDGQIMYHGVARDNSPEMEIRTFVFLEGIGEVVREGQGAPGTAPGVVFSGLTMPSMNSEGDFAIRADIERPDGSVGRGVWAQRDGDLGLVAQSGEIAPYGEDDAFFHLFKTAYMDEAGRVIFHAEVDGVTSSQDEGIWVATPDGMIRLVVRQGQMFDVNIDPLIDDFRLVHEVELAVRGDLVNDGTDQPIVFFLAFADGSEGIFSATVPEPSSALLCMGLGGVLLLRSGRLRR